MLPFCIYWKMHRCKTNFLPAHSMDISTNSRREIKIDHIWHVLKIQTTRHPKFFVFFSVSEIYKRSNIRYHSSFDKNKNNEILKGSIYKFRILSLSCGHLQNQNKYKHVLRCEQIVPILLWNQISRMRKLLR